MAHGLSCSMACGIFPDQGSNPCPCTGRRTLNHCATREVPALFLDKINFKIITIAIICWMLKYINHYARYFKCIISFHLQNNPRRSYYYFHSTDEETEAGRVYGLPKTTHLVSGRAQLQTQAVAPRPQPPGFLCQLQPCS